jgi:hypothetical protein
MKESLIIEKLSKETYAYFPDEIFIGLNVGFDSIIGSFEFIDDFCSELQLDVID